MIEAIAARRSIRKYTPQPVPDALIHTLLESARLAPSGRNTQPWHFIVIRDQQRKEQLVDVCGKQSWMLSAPVFIACIADPRTRIAPEIPLTVDELSAHKELKLVLRDTAIGIEHLVLEAVQQGLGTCWVAQFTQEQIRPLLGVPEDRYVVSIVTLGYPAEAPAARIRKNMVDIVHYECWSEKRNK